MMVISKYVWAYIVYEDIFEYSMHETNLHCSNNEIASLIMIKYSKLQYAYHTCPLASIIQYTLVEELVIDGYERNSC